jgi:hypothetical protein
VERLERVKIKKYMLRFQPKRSIEDVFINLHNTVITKLLLCKNNVQIGMNGQSIAYITGYQVKSQQKEEQLVEGRDRSQRLASLSHGLACVRNQDTSVSSDWN